MRRIYLKPETEMTTYYGDVVMGAASPGRYVGGGPTEDTDTPLPGVAGDYTGDEDDDPLNSGHGQGSGGGGNRAKEWDMWDFDPWG